MTTLRFPLDVRPVYAVATELSVRAEILRARAMLVAGTPHHMHWSSPGARAYAVNAAEIGHALLLTAQHLDDAAERFRSTAVRLQAQHR